MKKFGKLALATMLAIAVAGVTFPVKAEDKPAAEKKEAPKPKRDTVPFHGKITAADKDSISIGDRKFNVTSASKFKKDGKPATLEDAKVGEKVGGVAKKDGDKLNIVTLNIGEKPVAEGDKKPATGDKKEKK